MIRKKHSLTPEETKTEAPKRKHCSECGIYRDGHRLVDDEGRFFFSPTPGMRFVFWSKGDIYQRTGTMIPCSCQAGNQVADGYAKDSENIHRAGYPIAEYLDGKIVPVIDKNIMNLRLETTLTN